MPSFASNALPDEDAPGLAALKKLTIAAGTILSVEFSTSSPEQTLEHLAPRVMIRLILNPAKGSNIHVELWLPLKRAWNGRFLGLGNGGAAGSIRPGNLAGPLERGYAVATTDLGTAPNSDSGIGNPEVWKDFGYRATHLMTVAAKQMVQTFYGEPPKFSYFQGSSTGGQQALQEAQRYPGDYDGIVANVPAHCRTPLHAYFLWNEQIFRTCPFSPAQEQHVITAALTHLAGREIPQTAGRLISDPRCAPEDIEAVIERACKSDPTLTGRHAAALHRLFDGPRHAVTGERIFCGIPLGSAFDIAHGNLYLFQWVFGAHRDLSAIDFGKDFDAYTATLGPYLNAENANLDAFENRGGKLLLISGSADACVPYHATLDYYERVIAHTGSLRRAQEFCRFYLIPGMSHSLDASPGINQLPDFLNLVVDWREKQTAPDRIPARRVVDGKTEIELPLYPYPQKTGQNPAGELIPMPAARGGVARVAERFRPPAAE